MAVDLYSKLTNEEDARACRDISDAACRETPGNFLLILTASFLTKLGDAIASPKTVLAWVATAAGAPAIVLGLLVPIRESGSMIPQLFIGGFVRALPVRKWVWVAGSVLQAMVIVGIGFVAISMTGAAAGWAILGLITVFSLARGLCSVASKDVLGKTIPKGRRGQLTGWSASLAGMVTLVFGLALLLPSLRNLDAVLLGAVLIGASFLWLLAAGVYAMVREERGETEGGANAIRLALNSLVLLQRDKPFRRFVVARALLMCSALSAPYYVALAQQRIGPSVYVLGLLVIASGLASLLSAPLWGKFADRSSRQVMFAAASVTAATGLTLFLVDRVAPATIGTIWLLPLAYFVLSIAHSGVRVGRKTYVVDLASGNNRTAYVSVSNTVIGGMLLAVGALGALAPLIGNAGMIGLLAAMGVAGALLSSTLKEV
ncbi:MAG TPA: MFS transporter [Burkholderiales bacterium]|nr:MFS transporter [Burkholderiales bacterium]